MFIKMLKDTRGSDHGNSVREFKKGEVYEVSDVLGKIFVDEKSAEETKAVKEPAKEPAKADNVTKLPGLPTGK